MLKRFLSILLSLTVVVIPSLTISSFAEGSEKATVVSAEPTEVIHDKPEAGKETLTETTPISPDSNSAPEKVEPSKTINLDDCSEQQLQELLSVVKNHEIAVIKTLKEKKSKAFANETFWQTCKRKCLSTCNSAIFGLVNGIGPAAVFSIFSYFMGQGFTLAFIRNLISTTISNGTTELLSLSGFPLLMLANHLASLLLAGLIVPGPKPPAVDLRNICQKIASVNSENYGAVCGSPNNTCPAFS